MSTLEILGTAATVLCVLLAVKRSVWQFPIGLAATTAFLFVFLRAQLYSSMLLQVFFSFVQFYGWWYWLRGDKGGRPRITTVSFKRLAPICALAIGAAAALSYSLQAFTDAAMAFPDAAIFALSVVAQILLDRKVLQNWLIWAVVNALSIWVYGAQGLWLLTALYAGLLLNCAWGYAEWRREMHLHPAAPS